MKWVCWRVCVLAVVLSLIALGSAGRASAAGYGAVTGQFVFVGPIPILKPLVTKGDTVVRDSAVCAKNAVPDESLLVDPATNGIANVFVYMPKAPSDIHPDLKTSKEKVVKFDQKGCRFFPHAMLLRTDQTVSVLNDDPILHNTDVHTFNNNGQNQTISPNDRDGVKWTFPLPERLATKVNCDIHSWMTAWWLILDHPYAAVSDKEGRFKIEKIPAGEHEFRIWQEQSGWVFGPKQRSIMVTIKANETTDLHTMKVPASAFAK